MRLIHDNNNVCTKTKEKEHDNTSTDNAEHSMATGCL